VNDTTMTHAKGCTRPSPWRDDHIKPGWIRIKCPECKHVANVPIKPKPQSSPAPVAATGYRCRDHHDQPVTWRGTGCTRCAADLKRRNAPKRDDDDERRTYR